MFSYGATYQEKKQIAKKTKKRVRPALVVPAFFFMSFCLTKKKNEEEK
jgi:hypothetical protein